MTLRPLPLLLAALMLPGCLSFGEDPPERLLRLTAEAVAPANAGQTVGDGRAVTVLPPTVPQELNLPRVPVRTAGGVAYLKDARWIDTPNRLFRDMLAETIAARTGRPVLDIRQYAIAPGMRLGGRMTTFGLDADAGEVILTYDATLARGGTTGVETRRFEGRVPSSDNPVAVAAALNRAANQVAIEVADWVGK
jgi:cholesterol transport system auxiliary component